MDVRNMDDWPLLLTLSLHGNKVARYMEVWHQGLKSLEIFDSEVNVHVWMQLGCVSLETLSLNGPNVLVVTWKPSTLHSQC